MPTSPCRRAPSTHNLATNLDPSREIAGVALGRKTGNIMRQGGGFTPVHPLGTSSSHELTRLAQLQSATQSPLDAAQQDYFYRNAVNAHAVREAAEPRQAALAKEREERRIAADAKSTAALVDRIADRQAIADTAAVEKAAKEASQGKQSKASADQVKKTAATATTAATKTADELGDKSVDKSAAGTRGEANEIKAATSDDQHVDKSIDDSFEADSSTDELFEADDSIEDFFKNSA